jgi:hypothetical protein
MVFELELTFGLLDMNVLNSDFVELLAAGIGGRLHLADDLKELLLLEFGFIHIRLFLKVFVLDQAL